MEFILNGRPVSPAVPEGASLLEVLREQCGLTSLKDGCAPEGSCGACTVIVDGRAVVSCAQPAARLAGRRITTLEGLDDEGRAAWADAFVAAGAAQCGFCSPGIVMKAEALLGRTRSPTRAEIARALGGHLCRCTGYLAIIEAIEAVARRRGGQETRATGETGETQETHEAPQIRVARQEAGVGGRAERYEGRDLVLGTKPYVSDMRVPGMLHGALRLSDHPRATVARIDASRARTHPGVVAVATWRDVPGERAQGLIKRDWPQFVAEGETTRYVGDVLAAVAAETRTAAREAAALIEVEYEVLEPVTDPEAALADEAPVLHEGGNVLSVSRVRRGDVDAAFAAAAHVASETFRTPFIEHAFLEPEAALAIPEDGGVHVYSQGQGVWDDRRQVASLLGLPEHQVRVTQVATGGAFGGKEDLSVQGHAALLALLTRRPVRLALSRRESICFHPKRHPMTLRYTVGCDAEGRLLGVRTRILGDTGAYASLGEKVLERAAGHACGAYRVPNVDVEAIAVFTNNPPCGAMRGFGAPQAHFAMEGMLDRLAERVGIDGWEMRWRNALEAGDTFGTGQVLGAGVGLKRTLLAVRDAYRSARYAGIACAVKNVGLGNGAVEYGLAVLRPERDGSVTLFHSWSEMGQGVHTILRQIACEELGLPPERIRVVVDTGHDLGTGETTASRATVLGGRAVMDAARRLRAALERHRSEDLAGEEFIGRFVVDWTTTLDVPRPVTHLAYGWATQVAVLDEGGRVSRIVAAHDVGRVMNPTLLRGQIEGGVHMGLGYALSEELGVDRGVPDLRLKSLGVLHAADMPQVETIFIEEHQPEGPYGAKGVGEIATVPTAPAVAAALHAFDGIRRTRLPMRDSPAARRLSHRTA